MSLVESPESLGCIGCVTAPIAQGKGQAVAEDEIVLAVPGADCAACIPQLEEGLAPFPGVRDVRVNLSLRRSSESPGVRQRALRRQTAAGKTRY